LLFTNNILKWLNAAQMNLLPKPEPRRVGLVVVEYSTIVHIKYTVTNPCLQGNSTQSLNPAFNFQGFIRAAALE
jgi:hypothetical protein